MSSDLQISRASLFEYALTSTRQTSGVRRRPLSDGTILFPHGPAGPDGLSAWPPTDSRSCPSDLPYLDGRTIFRPYSLHFGGRHTPCKTDGSEPSQDGRQEGPSQTKRSFRPAQVRDPDQESACRPEGPEKMDPRISVRADAVIIEGGMGDEGIEPSTAALRVRCSTN